MDSSSLILTSVLFGIIYLVITYFIISSASRSKAKLEEQQRTNRLLTALLRQQGATDEEVRQVWFNLPMKVQIKPT